REEGDAAHKDAPAAEEVGRASAEQQESAVGERVCGDDPLEVLRREMEMRADRRQRDVDDRDVEDRHEEGGADDGEREPAAGIGSGECPEFLLESGGDTS